jgi:predicted ATPase
VLHAEQGISLAERLDHPYSQALALAYAALVHQMRRDTPRVLECAERAVALCDKYAFAYYGDWAKALIGWAHGQKRPAEGIAEIETALAQLDGKRAQARRPYYLSLLAETCALAGNRQRAASMLDTAINMARDRIDVWWLPALYFQKSELEAAASREPMRQLALALARSHGSRGLERRILTADSAKSL